MVLRRTSNGLALAAFLCAPPLDGGPPCQKDVHLIFQAEPLGSSPELFFGSVDELAVEVPPDTPTGRHTAAAAIVSNLPGPRAKGLCQGDGAGCSGLQGWAVSIALEGELELTGATVTEANPDIVCGGAFITVHLVDPDLPGPGGMPQGQGIISAVVFLCGVATTLQPHGTETVLGITVEAPRPASGQSISGKLRCHEGLKLRGAPPSENVITVLGQSFPFCSCRQLEVRFDALDSVPFRRCDFDGNGRLEIADPVSILNWLFRRGAAVACKPAADCDGNRQASVTDAVYALRFLFGGGPPPPAPFPDCGLAADPAEVCSTRPGACPG